MNGGDGTTLALGLASVQTAMHFLSGCDEEIFQRLGAMGKVVIRGLAPL
ncbi:MAG: hypothetical protein ACYDA6_04885 [Solirubrobacteraceae bacterium]